MTLSLNRVMTCLTKPAGMAMVMMLAVAGSYGLSMADPVVLTPDWTVESNQAGSQFGSSVSSAGDVNGDGYNDVIVGNPLYDNGKATEGRAYLYMGSASGLSTTSAWSVAEGFDGRFGHSVASAGDVNGDGFDDVIVGNPLYNDGKAITGQAYLYLGSATGLATTPAWTANGENGGSQFGFSVARAGDVNNDGYDDVIVGAPTYNDGKFDVGKAYLYLGSGTGLEAKPAWTETGQVNSAFGFSVGSAGDVNNDGYDDLVVGNPLYDEVPAVARGSELSGAPADHGQASVYLGSLTGLAMTPAWTAEGEQSDSQLGFSVAPAGDINNDGYGDVIVGNPLYNTKGSDEGRAYVYMGSLTGLAMTPAWTGEGDQSGSQFGVSVSGAGDFNNDGYGDVIVGNPLYNTADSDAGRAYIYLGSGTGLAATANWVAEGGQAGSKLGFSVAPAGDVNNDGHDDVIVGNPLYGSGEPNEGAAYAYYGSDVGVLPTVSIDEVEQLEGTDGITEWIFQVTVTNPNSEAVAVDFVTKDGTATGTVSGGPSDGTGDYRITSGTLSIGAGGTKGSIVVRVTADGVTEPNETFFVNLSNPRNATIVKNQGQGTIRDDDQPTAVLLSQFRADPVGQGVELRWQFGGTDEVDRVMVERSSTIAGPWIEVAGERKLEGEVTVLVDRAEPGLTYYYRLRAVIADGRITTFGPFTATTSTPITTFALTSIWPNPSQDVMQFGFTVPRESWVKLNLYDLQGREVAVLAEGTYRPGRYQVSWRAKVDHAPAGIYFARYQTPVGAFVRRVVVSP